MIVKFLDKFGKLVKSITSIGYLPVDVEPVKGSKHLLTSGAVAEIVPESASQNNPLMTAEDTERMIDIMKPIDAMMLRFEFSKKDYSPVVAGVGSAGTWAKVDSPTLNIWDWTNDATDWTSAFQGAFPDADNEVCVIAAGDTSSVTKTENMFAGIYTNKPVQTSYSLTSRNNIVYFCGFDFSNVTNCKYMFTGTTLRSIGKDITFFGDAAFLFADSFIKVDYLDCSGCTDISGIFARANKIERIDTIKVGSLSNPSALVSMFWNYGDGSSLIEFGGFEGDFSVVTDFMNMFAVCKKLKKITKEFDLSNVKNATTLFNGCRVIDLSNVSGFDSGNLTTMYATFNNCQLVRFLPNMNTSNVTDFTNAFSSMYSLEEIPDLDVSSATKVQSMFSECYNAKTGILEMYNKLLARGASITNHTKCFKNCGINTPEGRAALAQIPQSWGGLAEE